MTEREQAANHLKVIRSLMERATVYRTISWPTALLGGSLAVILSALIFFRERAAIEKGMIAERAISEEAWVFCWMVALALTVFFNAWLVSRKSRREGRPFFSPGLKMGLRALLPPMLAGGVIGVGLTLSGAAALGASLWVTCYGLALLATRGLAPVSMLRLGHAFLYAGLACFLYSWREGPNPLSGEEAPHDMERSMLAANLIMAICFGLFHLIYGVIVMRASGGEEVGQAERDGES